MLETVLCILRVRAVAWESGILESGSSIAWLGDRHRLLPLSVKCREGMGVLGNFSDLIQMLDSLLSTRYTWTRDCSLGFKTMPLPLWAAMPAHKINCAETYTKITGGQHAKGMSCVGSILPGERDLLVVGYGKDHGRLPGRKGPHGVGQALIDRENIGGKLLLPKISYLSWGPRRTIHFL